MNEYVNNREPCDTMMVGSAFGNYGYGIALPRHSPMREVLSDAVLRLRETQVLTNLRKKWWIERGQCNAAADADRSATNALALINVAGVFHILVGGLLLSLLVAALELFCHLKWHRRRYECSSKIALTKEVQSVDPTVDNLDFDPWTMQ